MVLDLIIDHEGRDLSFLSGGSCKYCASPEEAEVIEEVMEV